MAEASEDQSCPCGRQRSYKECCHRLHNGMQPKSAKQLLRARFSAFKLGKVNYLIESLHPSKRRSDDAGILAANVSQLKLRGLTILRRAGGKAKHSLATIEHLTTYRYNGDDLVMHELAHFVKEDERWYYLDSTAFFDGTSILAQLNELQSEQAEQQEEPVTLLE